MWDSSADHKNNTVLLLFVDAIDPLGPAGLQCLYNADTTGDIKKMYLMTITYVHTNYYKTQHRWQWCWSADVCEGSQIGTNQPFLIMPYAFVKK